MDIEEISIQGVWWRQTPALGNVPRRQAHPPNGRWQRGAVVEGLYLAESPETAWAEWYRYLAEAGILPEQALPRNLWKWKINLNRVADLSTIQQLQQVGLYLPDPDRSNWETYQAIGENIHKNGYEALIAPSAARPTGQILCVFRASDPIEKAKAIPPPQTFITPPPVPRGMTT